MKKVLAIAVLGVFVLASCKKDYTCSCTGGSATAVDYPLNDMKKKDAEASCTTFNTGFALFGGTCALK